MNIGFVSDLHLEVSSCNLNTSNWDVAILAGDICAYPDDLASFIERNLPVELPIVFVAGNHEFEQSVLPNRLTELRNNFNLLKHQVHFLNNESVIINGVKFIGSTLWTDFAINSPTIPLSDSKALYDNSISEAIFYQIKDKYKRLTSDDIINLFNESYKFLNYELLKSPFSGKKVVITHFSPSERSVEERFKDSNNSYWHSNLDNLIPFSDYWIHGHIHSSVDYMVEDTRVLANPRGYSKFSNLSENVNFDNGKYFTII